MVGRVQHNWSLNSLRLHPHKQSSVETGYLGDRIIKSVNSMLNIFHRSSITNPQNKTVDVRGEE